MIAKVNVTDNQVANENPFAKKKPLTISSDDDVGMLIETVSGLRINPTNPDSASIDIQDIGWALSRIPRFAGHTITRLPYNVAQHSVYVAELVEAIVNGTIDTDLFHDSSSLPAILVDDGTIYLKALLHDAHEAYTGDIPSPIKRIPELRETLKLIEGRLDHAIFTQFQLDETTEDEKRLIKYADRLAQAVESYQFMPSRGLDWNLPSTSLVMLQQFPAPAEPLESYKKFIEKFNYYSQQ
jgi:5'-deoxynucleotidase YfbR-like HD superfamily hydrolase